jgi:hypothetical protein
MATFSRTQSIEHRIGPSGRLDLRVTSGDVTVSGVAGEEARVDASFQVRASSDDEADRIFEQVKLHVDQRDGMLVVEEPGDQSSLGALVKGIFSGRGQAELEVRVSMPRGAELRLDGVSGDLSIEGLVGDQRYNTVSGDLSLTALGGDVRVNTVSGDITARAAQSVAVRAETVSGDFSLVAPAIRGLRATTVSGDVEVEGQLEAGHDYRIETVSGDATVGLLGGAIFEVRGIASDVSSDLDHRLEGRQDRRRLTVGDGGPTVIFNSMSGNLAINRPRRLDRIVPAPPAPPMPPQVPSRPVSQAPSADDQLAILQALERGEIDVDEASRRLAGESSRA